VTDWLARVGLSAEHASRYPHQFSGGQRQHRDRRALAIQLTCDLRRARGLARRLDQAQVLNLLLQLRRESASPACSSARSRRVKHVSDRVAIMYLGRVVELGTTAEIFARPRHPYTRALLDSVPRLSRGGNRGPELKPIAGELPSPLAPPTGCHFHPRCPHAIDIAARAPGLCAVPAAALRRVIARTGWTVRLVFSTPHATRGGGARWVPPRRLSG
jgi:peptide/nickel transport system ATP-binding protein